MRKNIIKHRHVMNDMFRTDFIFAHIVHFRAIEAQFSTIAKAIACCVIVSDSGNLFTSCHSRYHSIAEERGMAMDYHYSINLTHDLSGEPLKLSPKSMYSNT